MASNLQGQELSLLSKVDPNQQLSAIDKWMLPRQEVSSYGTFIVRRGVLVLFTSASTVENLTIIGSITLDSRCSILDLSAGTQILKNAPSLFGIHYEASTISSLPFHHD